MDGGEIVAALTDLAAEVGRRGIRAKLFLVGGAVMVLVFGARTGTADVDGAASNPAVYEVARQVGQRRGLPDEWINDAAKGFIPLAVEPDWQPVLAVGDVEIVAADEWTMLAMKLRAGRTRDLRDVRFLLERCRIATEQDALALYDEYFPEDPIEPRALALLRTALTHNVETGRGPARPRRGRGRSATAGRFQISVARGPDRDAVVRRQEGPGGPRCPVVHQRSPRRHRLWKVVLDGRRADGIRCPRPPLVRGVRETLVRISAIDRPGWSAGTRAPRSPARRVQRTGRLGDDIPAG